MFVPFCDFLRSSSLSKLLGCQSANHRHICEPSSARFVRTMDITHHRFGICICIFGLSTVGCVRIIDITRHCFWEFEPQAQFQQWKCASQYLYRWFLVSWCCILLCSFLTLLVPTQDHVIGIITIVIMLQGHEVVINPASLMSYSPVSSRPPSGGRRSPLCGKMLTLGGRAIIMQRIFSSWLLCKLCNPFISNCQMPFLLWWDSHIRDHEIIEIINI